MFAETCSEAMVVFIETDHSPRNIEVNHGIPWIRSFVRTEFFGDDNWTKFEELPLIYPLLMENNDICSTFLCLFSIFHQPL